MNRIFHPYWDWECYWAGMYATHKVDNGEELYCEFLADIPRFSLAMARVITSWPKSCEHFLTDPHINNIAWMGQSAMCIATGVPRRYRAGYMLLNNQQRKDANNMAAKYIELWKAKGYPEDIPDEAPEELEALKIVPSYRLIAKALLANDVNLLSLGMPAKTSIYYGILKKCSLDSTKKTQ